MKKIICIGECSLNIVADSLGVPRGSMPGGRFVNAATILARKNLPIIFASDAANDSVGQVVVDYLAESGVEVKYIDRFTEGRTPLNMFVGSGEEEQQVSVIRYDSYPEEAFDIVWPKIEKDDIILYGGFYSIDKRMHERILSFLTYAKEMKALLVYSLGYRPSLEPRITRVMPAILENLELADLLIARDDELEFIFGQATCDDAYRNHIDFYCHSLVCIDTKTSNISFISGKESSTASVDVNSLKSMMWNAGVLSGVVEALFSSDYKSDDFDYADEDLRQRVLSSAVSSSDAVDKTLVESWQRIP